MSNKTDEKIQTEEYLKRLKHPFTLFLVLLPLVMMATWFVYSIINHR